MQIIKIDPKNPSLKAIKIAAEVIKKGGAIIYPTDTIYGIGVSALDQAAIERVYKIKERPGIKPLSVAVSDVKMAKKYCVVGKKQEEIFSALLPGAFTLIFPAKTLKKNKILTISNGTASIRIPDFRITALMAKELKIPFTATSANISGLPGSGNINTVLKQLGNKKNLIDLVLDAGILPKKDPSVIVDLTGSKPKIIRK
jgi:L-threonylcarbamoyladenylate synthase